MNGMTLLAMESPLYGDLSLLESEVL
jgi:hypothetical protein